MDELEKLKLLAGITGQSNAPSPNEVYKAASDKKLIEKQNNIRPGSKEWFELWFPRKSNNCNMVPAFRGRVKK